MYIKRESNLQFRKTTKNWGLCLEWKDGSTSWECLASLEESNPVEIAKYAAAHGLESEPAFACWWVPLTLKRRKRITAALNKHYHKRTHKFRIEVPKTYEN